MGRNIIPSSRLGKSNNRGKISMHNSSSLNYFHSFGTMERWTSPAKNPCKWSLGMGLRYCLQYLAVLTRNRKPRSLGLHRALQSIPTISPALAWQKWASFFSFNHSSFLAHHFSEVFHLSLLYWTLSSPTMDLSSSGSHWLGHNRRSLERRGASAEYCSFCTNCRSSASPSPPLRVHISSCQLPGEGRKNGGKFPHPGYSYLDIKEHPIHKTAASLLPDWCVWLTLCSVLMITQYLDSRQLALFNILLFSLL